MVAGHERNKRCPLFSFDAGTAEAGVLKRGLKRGLSLHIPGSLCNPHLSESHPSFTPSPHLNFTPSTTPIRLPLHQPPTPANTNPPPYPSLRFKLPTSLPLWEPICSLMLQLIIFSFFLSIVLRNQTQSSNSLSLSFFFCQLPEKEKEKGSWIPVV